MTSPSSVITDAEAREIAEAQMRRRPFVDTGEIDADFYRWAKGAHAYRLAYRGELSNPVYDLAAYVAFHGERPAQPGWREL